MGWGAAGGGQDDQRGGGPQRWRPGEAGVQAGGYRREDVGIPPVSGSGSWAMAMTFRERTLEEEQAGSAKDRRGLALPRLSCLPWDGRVH